MCTTQKEINVFHHIKILACVSDYNYGLPTLKIQTKIPLTLPIKNTPSSPRTLIHMSRKFNTLQLHLPSQKQFLNFSLQNMGRTISTILAQLDTGLWLANTWHYVSTTVHDMPELAWTPASSRTSIKLYLTRLVFTFGTRFVTNVLFELKNIKL